MRKIDLLKVAINKKYIFRGDEIKYLVILKYQADLFERVDAGILKATPNEKFLHFVEEQMDNYLAGKQVDKDILTPIMNCADMYASGESIALHAGDYIALQTNFMKSGRS